MSLYGLLLPGSANSGGSKVSTEWPEWLFHLYTLTTLICHCLLYKMQDKNNFLPLLLTLNELCLLTMYLLLFLLFCFSIIFFFRFCIALCWSCLLKRSINQTEFDWFSVGMLSFTFDSTHNWEHTQSLHIIIDWLTHSTQRPNYRPNT